MGEWGRIDMRTNDFREAKVYAAVNLWLPTRQAHIDWASRFCQTGATISQLEEAREYAAAENLRLPTLPADIDWALRFCPTGAKEYAAMKMRSLTRQAHIDWALRFCQTGATIAQLEEAREYAAENLSLPTRQADIDWALHHLENSCRKHLSLRSSVGTQAAANDVCCPVCLESMPRVIGINLPCAHVLHQTCLDALKQHSSVCPVCRSPF